MSIKDAAYSGQSFIHPDRLLETVKRHMGGDDDRVTIYIHYSRRLKKVFFSNSDLTRLSTKELEDASLPPLNNPDEWLVTDARVSPKDLALYTL